MNPDMYSSYSRVLNESQSEEKINNEIEWSLSAFLEYYNSWSFEKIEVINDKDLAWYILLSETEKQKEYDVFKSEKPENTSLSDIWIEVLWKSNIIVKTEEESILKSMVKEILPLFLFLVIITIAFRFMMPKWSWPMWINTRAGTDTSKTKITTKFADVAGMEEVKEELTEIVDFLKNPEKNPEFVRFY